MTPEEFTKHVGAKTFADAVSVTLRTKASDEDTKEWQHDKIKELAKERDQLRAQVASLRASVDALVKETSELRSRPDALRVDKAEFERDRLMADVVQYRRALETLIAQCDKTDWMGVAGEMDAELDAARAALATEHPGAPLVEAVGKALEALKKDFDRFTALGRGGWAIDCAEALALLTSFAPKVDQSTESA